MSLDYAADPAWSDVTPVPQDDGPSPVVAIAYSAPFVQSMSYFRAIMAKQELSERALALTHDVIQQNSANYTVWDYRRQCLLALGHSLVAELDECAAVAEQSPKNYQLWHHRRTLVHLVDGADHYNDTELAFIERILALDAKNYHAWSHRQWLVKRFSLGGASDEHAFVDRMLALDVRNNSAWNYKMFLLSPSITSGANDSSDGASACDNDSVVEWGLRMLAKSPHNESAWNFIKHFVTRQRCQPATKSKVLDYALSLVTSSDTDANAAIATASACGTSSGSSGNSFAMALLVDVYGGSDSMSDRATARRYCQLLASAVDPVRRNYWQYRASIISTDMDADASASSE